jgi:hypothetical protein
MDAGATGRRTLTRPSRPSPQPSPARAGEGVSSRAGRPPCLSPLPPGEGGARRSRARVRAHGASVANASTLTRPLFSGGLYVRAARCPHERPPEKRRAREKKGEARLRKAARLARRLSADEEVHRAVGEGNDRRPVEAEHDRRRRQHAHQPVVPRLSLAIQDADGLQLSVLSLATLVNSPAFRVTRIARS